MKGCIHRLSDRGVGYSTWRRLRQCGRWQFVQKNRTVVASAAYVSELDDLGPEYDAPHTDPVEDPMKKILEEFGLEVNTLFRDAHKYEMEQLEAGWDEEAGMYDWEKPVESTELDFVFDGTEEFEPTEEEWREAQAKADIGARQRHQMEQVYEKAFELHHSQMARSVNPYATTLYYAQFLQDISKIDEAGETSDIPGWIRATFVMEKTFDEWNEQLRTYLAEKQEKLAVNFQARKLQEYRESVSELQGDFDYSQLTFPTAEGVYLEEKKEDLSGVGDNLDDLLDVLPGKDAAAEAQAQDYADEIMLEEDSDGNYEQAGGEGEQSSDLVLGDEKEKGENVIDF